MKKIYLGGEKGKGLFVLVDDKDYVLLNKYRWSLSSFGYAQRAMKRDGKWQPVLMHREILGFSEQHTDHINMNRLDNRRINLRLVERWQNQANRGVQSNNTSGAKGVGWLKERRKWRARLKYKNQTIVIGSFVSKEEAIMAYDSVALQMYGKYASVNQ